MLSARLHNGNLYLYMHLYLYLFNVYLFLYLQLFYAGRAKFNNLASILAFAFFMSL